MYGMKLFEPTYIGNMELKNRIVMAPMTLNLCKDGFVTERMIRFFEERARGGVGLIVIGDGIVDFPIGNNSKEALAIDNDKYIPGLRKLVEAVKAYDVKIVMQLSHGGRRAGRVSKATGRLEVTRGLIPVAPSSIPHPVPGYVVPRELTVDEIEEIVEKFGEAARRAVEAGFDGVGLHCAHMYLCGQFLSPWANKRMDEYGGDLNGRLKFVVDVLRRIRENIGDKPIICRINGEEPEGGNTLEDIKKIARRLEEIGVNAISVSVGFGAAIKTRGFIPSVAPMRFPQGCIVHLAENIKKEVSIPVIVANKIRDVDFAEKILEDGKADLIALGRPLIADPEYPRKALEGKVYDIVPCTSCCRCIQYVLEKEEPICCEVNPIAGKEGEYVVSPASRRRKVLIIGGGPAGMEAAIVLARRGHEVHIIEREKELGGRMLLAAIPPGKSDIQKLIKYMREQVKKLNVNVELGLEATPEIIEKINPEVVVVAIGGKPYIPCIPGVDDKHVVLAEDILKGNVKIGEEAVVIGGGQVGLEVAEYLAEIGKKVTIVEMLEDVGGDMPNVSKLPLIQSLENHGVTIFTKTVPIQITKDGVIVSRRRGKQIIKADTIVLATGFRANSDLVDKLKGRVKEVYAIGDCREPGNILSAIHDGFKIALKI
jgi:2,4-dienoyl-CoA reductase-like NADH-dependent reductase (Old Yellow Enzyme family)